MARKAKKPAKELSPQARAGRRGQAKGASFERDTAEYLREFYPGAKRSLVQRRDAREGSDVWGTPFWVEAKFQNNVNIIGAVKQALADSEGKMPVLVFVKRTRQPPEIVVVPLEQWREEHRELHRLRRELAELKQGIKWLNDED